MKRLLAGSLLGATLMFAWGGVSWMVLPFHVQTMKPLPNEAALVAELQRGAIATGTYAYPARQGDEAAWAKRMQEGPVGTVTQFASGQDPMSPLTFLQGFVLGWLRCVVGALLLCAAAGGLPTYWHRVLFVTGLGFVSAFVHAGAWSWGLATADHVSLMAIDELVSWFLAGLALAAFGKAGAPTHGTAHGTTFPAGEAPAA